MPLARAGLPFAVTPGNHDASTGTRFAFERELYRAQWLPRKPALDFVDAADYPFNYAFRVHDTLFVSLDATHVGHLSTQSKHWLEQLLPQQGSKYQHRVVFSHVPLWPFAVGRERDYLGDHELEAILQRGKVGVVLSGHHHAYFPGYKDGVRFVSQGSASARRRARCWARASTAAARSLCSSSKPTAMCASKPMAARASTGPCRVRRCRRRSPRSARRWCATTSP